MKLPRTKLEPSISNGTPHGTPYTMSVRCVVHGTYQATAAADQVLRGLNRPWPEPLTWPTFDQMYATSVVIPKVPISSVMQVSYDNTTIPAGAPAFLTPALMSELKDFVVAVTDHD
jgi:hypothetical protein